MDTDTPEDVAGHLIGKAAAGHLPWNEQAKAIAAAIREAIAAEREACAQEVEGALCDQGTDDPHEALGWAAAAIRARR